MSDRRPSRSGSERGSLLWGAGMVALAVVCCAGPALLASGLLALVGGALGSPVVLGSAALVLAGVIGYVLRRRARAHRARAVVPSGAVAGGAFAGSVADECCVRGEDGTSAKGGMNR